jgi:hypothetical protein
VRTSRYFKRSIKFGTVLAAIGTVVLVGAIAARGGQPQVTTTRSLAPNPVTSGQDALYGTSYENTGGTTLTNASIVVTLPAGSVFQFSDPAVCTAGAAAQNGTIPVTCPRGQMPNNALFSQQIVFTAPTTTIATLPITVTSKMTFNERDSDGTLGKEHTDTVFAESVATDVYPVNRDLLGKCVSKNGASLSTEGSATSKTNPQITSATVPANSTLACSPVVLREVPAAGVTGVCPSTCQTQISITDSPLFSVTSPVLLTFKLDGSLFGKTPDPATFKWYKNGTLVPNCDPFQPLLDPCIETRAPNGKGLLLGVRWSGNDPSWGG